MQFKDFNKKLQEENQMLKFKVQILIDMVAVVYASNLT